MEYISNAEAKAIMSIGYSGELSTLDLDQGHVLLNTWVSLINEVAPHLTTEFVYYLKRVGLVKTIDEAKAELDKLRGSNPGPGRGIFHALCLELQGNAELCTIALGFPVRFTLDENPSVYNSTIDAFFENDRFAREYTNFGLRAGDKHPDGYTYHQVPAWLLNMLSQVGRSILRDWKTSYNETFWRLPKGATYEVSKAGSPAKKLLAAAKLGFDLEGYFQLPPDACCFDDSCVKVYDRWHESITYLPFRENVSTLTAVPKNYKTFRTIATEECYRQLHLGRLGDSIMRTYDRSRFVKVGHFNVAPGPYVKFRDQTRNQELARIGSITGSLATIDFSRASDSVTAVTAYATLPPDLYNEICRYRANRIEVDGKRRFLNMFSTMGSRVTFPLETHIFWCIAMVTRMLAECWFGVKTKVSDYSAYGDDIIVPASVAELFMDLARLCGFTPNPEKSHWTGNYRESCGEEYYNGVSARGIYWPRTVVDLSDTEGLSSMLALQHRLVGKFPSTARQLAELLISRFPNLTFNEIGTDADCIWSAFPPLQEKLYSVGDTECRMTKVSRIHSYVEPKRGLSQEEMRAGEALALVSELRGVRIYDDPLLELLSIPSKVDHRVYTGTVKQSLRARYEKE